MGKNEIMDEVLARVLHSSSDAGIRTAVMAYRHSLLGTAGTASSLLRRLSEREDCEDAPETLLFEALAEQARMDVEDKRAEGRRFLEEAEAEIAALTGKEALTSDAVTVLGCAYSRAGLDVPEALIAYRMANLEQRLEGQDEPPRSLDAGLDEIFEQAEGDPFTLHAMLTEVLATMPVEAKAALGAHIAARQDALCRRLALYWLLDPSPGLRAASAGSLRTQAAAGRIDAQTAELLPKLRPWLPADPARAALDEAIAETRRHQIGGSGTTVSEDLRELGETPVKIDLANASLPDSSGAQSFTLVVRRGKRREVAMILAKEGQGIKEAYSIPCKKKAEADAILDQLDAAIGATRVKVESMKSLLAARVAEGLAAGRPPAHGFLDIAESAELLPLPPQEKTARDWLSEIGWPQERQKLGPRKLQSLISESRDWPLSHPSVFGWFEDSAELREAMESAADPEEMDAKLRAYLETRRGAWAERIALAARVMRDNPPKQTWMSFAATAEALLDDTPLTRIPVMDQIRETTLDALENGNGVDDQDWVGNAMEFEGAPGGQSNGGFTPSDLDTSPAQPGELENLMVQAGVAGFSMPWLDGYLTAFAVAPNTSEPMEFLPGLFQSATNDMDEASGGRLVVLLLGRFNEIIDRIEGGLESGTPPVDLPGGDGLLDWARGFADAKAALPSAWPRRSLKSGDRKMLSRIADLGKGKKAEEAKLRSQIPQWLTEFCS